MSEDHSAPTYLDSVLTNTLPFAKKLFEKFLVCMWVCACVGVGVGGILCG